MWDLGGRLRCHTVNKDPITGANGGSSACPTLGRASGGKPQMSALANIPKRKVWEGCSKGRGHPSKTARGWKIWLRHGQGQGSLSSLVCVMGTAQRPLPGGVEALDELS